ncbi:MAG TPA: DUF885 family protein [Actinomycetes bacterium]|nr:DUF885 family protein [Actinomycetes bacterium]
MQSRLRAVLDLMIPTAREEAGRHEYDGQIQDLSDEGVQRALHAIELSSTASSAATPTAPDDLLRDPHDDAHLAAFEQGALLEYGALAAHRTNPLVHLFNLELTCYERDYAPKIERDQALTRHLGRWPDAVDMAVKALDQVAAPVAASLVEAARGLALGIPHELPGAPEAAIAQQRFVQHLEQCAATGSPETAIGESALAQLMGVSNATEVDINALASQADQEKLRLLALLGDACHQLRPGTPVTDVVAELIADHPDADGVIDEAKTLTDDVIAFTTARGLVSHLDGECVVGLSPPSRRWATAMLSWAAPGERDTPTRYDITPPEPSWPVDEQTEWLSMFNRASMMAITVHEVAPGHFAHSRALRRAPGDIRRTLYSNAFAEGWAHYTEEMLLEEGYRADDPRYAAGVALEALCRVTRLSCAIGLHTGQLTVAEATKRFQSDAFLSEAAARSEAQRGTFDPTYGIYTWGKWEILRTREEAKQAWGSNFSLRRFHDALLELGSPPIGLLSTAVSRG